MFFRTPEVLYENLKRIIPIFKTTKTCTLHVSMSNSHKKSESSFVSKRVLPPVLEQINL